MAASHRIVIIERDDDIRSLLEVMIDLDERFELVGSAADGAAGVRLTHDREADAVLVDLELSRLDGLEGLEGLDGLDVVDTIAMRSPRPRIMVLSAFPDPITLIDVLNRGADAYLDRATAWSEVLPTLAALCDDAFLST